ncbi:TetR/AcrR family transcriptional regulator [Pseudonocardia acidicola]|uniref:TetR/AcrR family transcriptional regulator n=1 Tax=Pseudonocardia acidicola TaxID=2724939 RepID=A0ABX1SF15_9PSEU|nr:TetR/AcrR family transcriptional regulator [Pseudonocardia acidicola]NMH99078.1 TetR/AcrR family transcriptional regulator [Pseudonocardia acidicola]
MAPTDSAKPPGPAAGSGTGVRARRTRALLLASAREVFERDGYVNARVADIAALAGVSHGTFYTYFSSRREVFRAVLSEVRADLNDALAVPLGDAGGRPDAATDFVRRVELSNRAFIQAYRRNRRMMALYEQAATIDPEVRAFRVEDRRAHVDRIARSIRRLQAAGLVDRSLDPRTAAAALASMVSNFCFHWLAMGEPFDDELGTTTLTRLWVRSLGLPA